MKLPIRNFGSKPLTLFIELQCDEYEVPVNGEAIVTLEDGRSHSMEVRDDLFVIYDEGCNAEVEIVERSKYAKD